MPGRNVYTVLTETATRHRDAAALHQPNGAKTEPSFRTYSWNEWSNISSEIGLGLRALGLRKGEIVCILFQRPAPSFIWWIWALWRREA